MVDKYEFMVSRCFSEDLDESYVKYSDYEALEAENKRLINIAGDALGFSEYQRDQDTVEVLAHHAKRLGEELAAAKGELAECRHRYAIKATSAEGESSILMGEIERLKAELMSLRARCERLEDYLFSMGAMQRPPCFCCGYNGPGYFNSEQHPCAKRHHNLIDPVKAKQALEVPK